MICGWQVLKEALARKWKMCSLCLIAIQHTLSQIA